VQCKINNITKSSSINVRDSVQVNLCIKLPVAPIDAIFQTTLIIRKNVLLFNYVIRHNKLSVICIFCFLQIIIIFY
jgi:hypothetical protein